MTDNEYRESFLRNKNVLKLIVVVVLQLCEFVYFKQVM